MNRKRAIVSDGAPAAIGPYSQAIAVGDLLLCSGQIPLSPDGELVGGDDPAAQTRQVLCNLAEVLRAAGGSLADVIKTTVYLASMEEYAAVNEEYARHFGAPAPARAAVEVRRLPKDVRVEIDAIAVIGCGDPRGTREGTSEA
jgi:2-iminobutanoate/2-iminopropanoate deaminase